MARNKYDVDEILEDKFDVNQLKRLAGYIRPYKKQMLVVLFLMLSASALGSTSCITFLSISRLSRHAEISIAQFASDGLL